MTARIEIDLNVRRGPDRTYAGFENVVGGVLPAAGELVEVFEPETGVEGFGLVTEIDPENQIIWLTVPFSALRVASSPLVPYSWIHESGSRGVAFQHMSTPAAAPIGVLSPARSA